MKRCPQCGFNYQNHVMVCKECGESLEDHIQDVRFVDVKEGVEVKG
jgi:uncharacterized membrane protein YvbJ